MMVSSKQPTNPRIRPHQSSGQGSPQYCHLLDSSTYCECSDKNDNHNSNNKGKKSSIMLFDSRRHQRQRRHASSSSSPVFRCPNYYYHHQYSSKKMIFLVFLYGVTTILLSASALDILEVETNGDLSDAPPQKNTGTSNNNNHNLTETTSSIEEPYRRLLNRTEKTNKEEEATSNDNAIAEQNKRRERIARHFQTLSEQQRYDTRTVATETTTKTNTYRIRPRIPSTLDSRPVHKESSVTTAERNNNSNHDGQNQNQHQISTESIVSSFSQEEDAPTMRRPPPMGGGESPLASSRRLPQSEKDSDNTKRHNNNMAHRKLPPILWMDENLPSVISASQDLPSVISASQDLPSVISASQDLPSVISASQDLPLAFSASQDLPSVISASQDLPLAFSTSQDLPPAFSNSQDFPPAFSNSQDLPPAFSNSQDLPPAFSNSQDLPPAFSNSQDLPPAFSNSQDLPPGESPSPSALPTLSPTQKIEPPVAEPNTLPPFTLPPFTLPPFTLPPSTKAPTTTPPTKSPTFLPTRRPSGSPTFFPTRRPTITPMLAPTRRPSPLPTRLPSSTPSKSPIAPEPGSPTVQEPGGGSPPGGNPPGEPAPNGPVSITEPGGGNDDDDEPSPSPSEGPSPAPTGAPSSLPSSMLTEVPIVPEPGEPGGGGNEPDNAPGEPGGSDNEPQPTPEIPTTAAPTSSLTITSTIAPTGRDNEPEEPGEPGGGGDEPGGSNDGAPDVSTLAPTSFLTSNFATSEVPTVGGNEPGEPGGVGNEPGEPEGMEINEPGEPGGGANEPAEPGGVGGNEPGEPGIGGSNIEPVPMPDFSTTAFPPFEPMNLGVEILSEPEGGRADRTAQPVTISMAATKPAESSDFTPLSENGEGYSPGSPEYNKERISIAEVRSYALRFLVPSRRKKSQPSLDDNVALEVLTSEYMLDYTKSVLGSNLLSIDGLVLKHIEVKGEVKKSSRMLSESSVNASFQSLTNATLAELDPLQQSFVFEFRSKFVFMHWTKITWALDLPGLAENLVKSSLSENYNSSLLEIIQGTSSISNEYGQVEDFFFASATEVVLDTALATIVEDHSVKIKEEKQISTFTKPKFPVYSVLAFLSLGLALFLCLVRWRILIKRENWLKSSGETHKIHAKDDEVTLFFSDTDADDNDNDEGNDTEEPQLNRLHENLKWALDYLIYGDDDEDEEYEEIDRAPKNDRSSVVEASESLTKRRGGLDGATEHASNLRHSRKRDATQ
jgi:hypothetical protein